MGALFFSSFLPMQENIPEEFLERFNDRFGANYRIRWSNARNEYHIEQKVGRALGEGFVDVSARNEKDYLENYDDRIRAKDGYILTFAVRPGTSMPCTECGLKLKVPAFRFESVQCPLCAMRGKTRMHDVGYFPLSDSLLDHLQKIDVFSGGNERVQEAVKKRNEFVMREQEMSLRRFIEPQIRERYNRLVGIPQWGRSGDQPMWDRSVPRT